MSDQASPETDLLRAAYAAFNARDINAALAVMSADVAWPKAFKGGVARGHEEVRAYWTEQWAEVDPHVDPGPSITRVPGGSWCRCSRWFGTSTGTWCSRDVSATGSR